MTHSATERRANVFWACARGKLAYDDWAAAEAHLLELVDRNAASGDEGRSLGLVAYRCEHCDRWHVGHSLRADRSERMPVGWR